MKDEPKDCGHITDGSPCWCNPIVEDYRKVVCADMKFYPECMIVEWGIKDCGFGQFTFYIDDDDKLCIDTEAMSKDTVKLVMNYLIDRASDER